MGKDKLLRKCYSWILDNVEFQRWRDSKQSRLLWIKGDPGKGKTMMMIALAEELSRKSKPRSKSSFLRDIAKRFTSQSRPCLVSYFFCQNTDSRLNNAASVLKGLVYLLAQQEKSLIRYIEKRRDNSKDAFEGPNAIYTVRSILRDMLNDSKLHQTYLLIDALDECNDQLKELLITITDEEFTQNSKVKWLVASRNRPDIAEQLSPDDRHVKISLEMNDKHIEKAVNAFIEFKVKRLSQQKQFDVKVEEEVQYTLQHKSEKTFLWVSLACKSLEQERAAEAISVLRALPQGLGPLYERMMTLILREPNEVAEYCKQILRSAATVYRPLQLQELVGTTHLPDRIQMHDKHLKDLVERCGSFLTLRNGTIYFIHQSAKDFLLTHGLAIIFPTGKEDAHFQIFSRSLQAMSSTLRRNIYNLKTLGYPAKQLEKSKQDSLAAMQYSCIYWVDHLHDASGGVHPGDRICLQDGGLVDVFIREKYLYWLEALSLCKSMAEGVVSMEKLMNLVKVKISLREHSFKA
jgi:hypothetical protein